jgi:RHS repeat-associated protein
MTFGATGFTGKERDSETGLDYFGARYMSSAQGRFTSPDPVHFQASMLEDPQRFNLYAYVRNNPLRFIDPKGEAIELVGDEEHRRKALEALKAGVGRRAAQYLYENKIETKQADGTATTKYYVGILSGGPSGKGAAFEKLSSTTAALGAIINDPQIATLRVAGATDPVPQLNKYGGSLSAYGAVGAASSISDRPPIWVVVQDPSTGKYPAMPGWNMTSGRDAPMGIADTTFHELGHAWWLMDYRAGRSPSDTNNHRAVELENQIRRTRQPQYGERINH